MEKDSFWEQEDPSISRSSQIIEIIKSESANYIDRDGDMKMPTQARCAVYGSDETRIDNERNAVAQSITSHLQLSETPKFDEKTKQMILRKCGISIFPSSSRVVSEGIVPCELSEFLIGIPNEKCYVRIKGENAELIPLSNLNGYVPGMIPDPMFPILPQLMTGVLSHKKVSEALMKPVDHFFTQLLIHCKAYKL